MMDFQDGLFAASLALFYSFIFLIYSTVGNLLVGHKTSKAEDLLYPFSKDFRRHFGTRERPFMLYVLYYIIFFVLLALFSSQIMTLRRSFRTWIDKLMGTEPPRVTVVSPVTSHTSVSEPEVSGGSTSQLESVSNTSVAGKSSKSKKKKTMKKKPIPRLSVREDTSEKLSRVLLKLDSIDNDQHDDNKTTPRTPPDTVRFK
ncbi:uncharacterized protein LOC128989929 isoform X3 [Macrosteles quadrilineatus]|uniref:uncharacterized protein LOC128989929 isoform X3 n=1 Tax=Macrosteles quadrilineatus TaxID=74068 RepID=UPI0023E244C3|nr:uncharacterized protein LOC128989929 isoform X3 [Macrosteles quadrilineatus]